MRREKMRPEKPKDGKRDVGDRKIAVCCDWCLRNVVETRRIRGRESRFGGVAVDIQNDNVITLLVA